MRILFLNSIGSKKWGGGEKWMLMAAKGLQAKGHKTIIGCAPHSVICKNAISKNLPVECISFKSDFDIIGFIRLLLVLKKQKINLVVCGQNKDTKIASVAAKLIGNVVVIARHGLQLISKKWKYKVIFSRMIDGIITNSQSIKNEYDSYNWFPEDFVRVIHNGFTLHEPVESFDLKFHFNIDENAFVILSAGRLAKQKGYNILVQAAAIARDQGKNWKFIIAGKGKLKGALKKQVQKSGLDEMVLFPGFFNNVLPLVGVADLFVLASWYEGMPNAVMEAMGMGKCCVITSVNGNNELITNEHDGLLVEAGDADSLYHAIERVADDPNYREHLGSNALAKIGKMFSEEQMIEELNLYLISKNLSKVGVKHDR